MPNTDLLMSPGLSNRLALDKPIQADAMTCNINVDIFGETITLSGRVLEFSLGQDNLTLMIEPFNPLSQVSSIALDAPRLVAIGILWAGKLVKSWALEERQAHVTWTIRCQPEYRLTLVVDDIASSAQ